MNRAQLMAQSVTAARAALGAYDHARAEAIARQMLVVDPESAAAHDLLGLALLSGGRPLDAVASFERAMRTTPIPPEFIVHLADAHRAAGRADQAVAIYQRAITAGASWPEVYHNLGVSLTMLHRDREALAAYSESLAHRPNHSPTLANRSAAYSALGLDEDALLDAEAALSAQPGFLPAGLAAVSALRGLGRVEEARARARRLTVVFPDSADAWASIASSLDPSDAVESWERANRLRPNDPGILTNLGVCLRWRGATRAAIDALRLAIGASPGLAAPYLSLGLALLDAGETIEAIECLEKARDLSPESSDPWIGLSRAHAQADNNAAALDAARAAASIDPDLPAALGALASCLERVGSPDSLAQAVGIRARLAALEPGPRTHLALAHTQERAGEMDAAFASARRALDADPTNHHAALAVAHGLLIRRDPRGWALYERRLHVLEHLHALPLYDTPRWGAGGTPDPVGTLLLWTGPALGDALFFARFIPAAARLASRVIVHAPPVALDLLAAIPGVTSVVSREASPPVHDAHAALASLPHLLGMGFDTPCIAPHIDPEAIERWRTQRAPGVPNVGLVWSGSEIHPNDAARSIDPARLAPFLRAHESRVAWISLQTHREHATRRTLPVAPFADWGPRLRTLADTAAACLALDHVITVDTATAHVAGTVAASTTTLLPYNPDWRWGLQSESTGWYPGMTLARQRLGEPWAQTLARFTLPTLRGSDLPHPQTPRASAPPAPRPAP